MSSHYQAKKNRELHERSLGASLATETFREEKWPKYEKSAD